MKKLKESKVKEVSLNSKIFINFFEEYALTKANVEQKKPVALHNLISDEKSHPKGKNYLIKASIIDIDPKNIKKWVGKSGYHFKIICKDLVNFEDDKTYTIILSEDESKKFIGLPFKPELKDKELKKKLKIVKRLLLKTN